MNPCTPQSSPWGPVQHSTIIADGIISVSTASHGGIHLSPERLAKVHPTLRQTAYSGNGWFEEDCDWAIVAATFPQDFKPAQVSAAVRTLKGWDATKPAAVALATTGPAAAIAAAFDTEHADDWNIGGMMGIDKGWRVSFYNRTTDVRRFIDMPYPEKGIYTTAELDALAGQS